MQNNFLANDHLDNILKVYSTGGICQGVYRFKGNYKYEIKTFKLIIH